MSRLRSLPVVVLEREVSVGVNPAQGGAAGSREEAELRVAAALLSRRAFADVDQDGAHWAAVRSPDGDDGEGVAAGRVVGDGDSRHGRQDRRVWLPALQPARDCEPEAHRF